MHLFERATGRFPHHPLFAFLLTCLLTLACNATTTPIEDVLPTVVERLNTPEPAGGVELDTSGLPLTPTPTIPPVAGGRSIGDSYMPEVGNEGYLVQHYIVAIALNPAVEQIQATTTIRGISNLHGLQQMSLDFVGFTITSATLNGQPAATVRNGKKLVISLPIPLRTGESFELVIAYEGAPTREPSPYVNTFDHLGLIYPGDGTVFAFGQPDGARYWFPNNDHPRDKATYRFEVTVPAGLTGVANGVLVGQLPSTMPDGTAGETFIWEHQFPMASNLAVVAAGPYTRIEGRSPNGVPLRHYVLPEHEADFRVLEPTIGVAIDWMSDLFGPYPFETFGYLTVSGVALSLETQTMVLLSDRTLNETLVVHEMAHMWFGNWVSLESWRDMWRNEGFATYISALWKVRGDPAGLNNILAGYDNHLASNSTGYALDVMPPEFFFSSDPYFNGALLIHRIRLEMGDDAFFAGLQLFMERYGGSSASHEAFKETMEEAGGVDLDPIFDIWLTMP